MTQEEINKQIFEKLEKIEIAIFGQDKTKKKTVKSSKKKSRSEDLTAPIQKLFDGGFFKEMKIDTEVISELQKRLLTKQKPLRSSVVNVLRGMTRKELLERVSTTRGKRILIAYKNKS